MAISYRKLWKTLGDQNLKKTDLIEKVGLSSSTIAKLSQNKTVTTDVLDRVLFVEYWGEEACAGIDLHDPNARIKYWLEQADFYAKEWKPSDYLFLED